MRNSHEHPGIVAKHLSHVVTLSRLEFCKEHPPFCLLSHSVSRREEGGPSVPDSRLEPETVPPHALTLLRRRCVTPAASFTSLSLSFLFCKIGVLIITTRVTAHTVRSLRPGTCRVLSVPKECQPRVLSSLETWCRGIPLQGRTTLPLAYPATEEVPSTYS